MKVLMTGASGLIGSALTNALEAEDCFVTGLVRGSAWNPEQGTVDGARLEGFDAIVHLAGESIAGGRWSPARKERIRESRVKGTTALAGAIANLKSPPKVFLSGSAIGFYGSRGAEVLTEESAGGSGFLAEVCQAWEAAAAAASAKGVRVVNMRTGIVLSTRGGALAKMLLPFRMGVGGKVGSGDQYMSWITLKDLCRVAMFALRTESVRGPVNAVAGSLTNAEFTKALGRAVHRPTIFPLPAFAARLAFGEMADALLLGSQRVVPTSLQQVGFVFEHAELLPALQRILRART